MKRRTRQSDQEVYKPICTFCHKRPVEIFQLDYEVCWDCHQKETFISFADQVDIPDV